MSLMSLWYTTRSKTEFNPVLSFLRKVAEKPMMGTVCDVAEDGLETESYTMCEWK